jgi:hypothetical protein
MKNGIVATEVITESEAIAQMKDKPQPGNAVDTADVTTATDTAVEEPTEVEVRLTSEQLQTAIAVASQAAVDAALVDIKAQNETLRSQLLEAQQTRQSLEQVFNVLGHPTPAARAATTSSRTPQGLAADFVKACESAPSRTWTNKMTGEREVQRDMSQARYLFHNERQQLRHDIEELVKQNGFLQGGNVASDAPTLRPDILPMLLDYMSMVLRETHRARYVYWQLPFYNLEIGKGPGDTIQVPRFRWLPEPTLLTDRTLTPGNALSAASNPIQAFAVSLVLAERGMGSGVPVGNNPVAIPEFFTANSMLNLENAVMTRLGHDYEVWEDVAIRSLFFNTSRIVYNDRGSVSTNPATVGAGDDGTMNENFLNMLYAYMAGLQIPTLDDGSYVLVLHDTALAQLKNSMATRNRYLELTGIEDLTNILQAAANREMGKVSGYVGTICNFHIFGTNAHSMGAAGTAGVQNEILGTGPALTRTSIASGRSAVARGIGMEAEIRRDNADDFQRLNRFTWLSHEALSWLDVDPVINAEQQLRVIQVRTLDVSV